MLGRDTDGQQRGDVLVPARLLVMSTRAVARSRSSIPALSNTTALSWRPCRVSSRAKNSSAVPPTSAYGRASAIASSVRPQLSSSSPWAQAAGHQPVATYGASISNASACRPWSPNSRVHSRAQNHSPRPAWNSTTSPWPSSRSRETRSGGTQPDKIRVRWSSPAASMAVHPSHRPRHRLATSAGSGQGPGRNVGPRSAPAARDGVFLSDVPGDRVDAGAGVPLRERTEACRERAGSIDGECRSSASCVRALCGQTASAGRRGRHSGGVAKSRISPATIRSMPGGAGGPVRHGTSPALP